jgi:capsular exopolysaccharide synthesis family protein
LELSAYLQILARRKWLVIIAGVVSVVFAVVVGMMTPPTYAASATLRAIPSTSASSSYAYLNYTDRNLNTLSRIATSGPALAEVRQKLGLASDRPLTVGVEVIPDSELIQVTVKDRDPVLAANAANVLASILVQEKTIADTSLYVADPAVEPGSPSILTSILYAIIALTAGTGSGVGLAFLVENLDTRIYTTTELKALTGHVILAEVPTSKERHGPRFLVDQRVYYRDIFRRLRTNLQMITRDTPLRILLLTSSEPEEGKSTVVANLARSLADTGQRIVLVDADFRCPTLHTFFDLSNEVGLSQVLSQDTALSDAIQRTRFDRIEMLPSGPYFPGAGELLASDRMNAVISQLAQEFNMVLLDAPALEVTADASALATAVEGVVLVIRCGWVKRATLLAACQQLANLGVVPIGIIINRVGHTTAPSHYQKYYREPDQNRAETPLVAAGSAVLLSVKPDDPVEAVEEVPNRPPRAKRRLTRAGKTKLPAPELQEDTNQDKAETPLFAAGSAVPLSVKPDDPVEAVEEVPNRPPRAKRKPTRAGKTKLPAPDLQRDTKGTV